MRVGFLRPLSFFFGVALALSGCPAPVDVPPSLDAGPGSDSPAMDTPGLDAPGTDAPGTDTPALDGSMSVCGGATDCDDGLFCSGVEMCAAGTCAAGAPPCAAASCNEATDTCSCTTPDADGDGANAMACGGTDCDDTNPNRAPGRTEVCDVADLDEDCDPTTYGFRDLDMDGAPAASCCNLDASGAMTCGDDCNDMRPGVNPSAPEVCNGLDDDCDTAVDEAVARTFYRDGDGDLYGVDDAATNVMGCLLLTGFAETAGDCNDTVGTIHPGAYDRCDGPLGTGIDDDCNGTPNDPPSGCGCMIGEPSRACMGALGLCASGNESCIDGNWGTCSVTPATEVCDGSLDEDCDGVVDDGVEVTCYTDIDADTYPPDGADTVQRCPISGRPLFGGCPVGYTNRQPLGSDLDCDDGRRDSSPAGVETCNGLDDNCDGTADEGLRVTCYTDGDNDTYAAMGAAAESLCPVSTRPAVAGCPVGYTNRAPTNFDCDDLDGTRSPGSLEVCNLLDDDCDGAVDDGVGVTCYADADGDEYAPSGAAPSIVCPDATRPMVGGCPVGRTNRPPMGIGSSDCDDFSGAISPAAPETCDAFDNDCDGMINEGVGVTCFSDLDNDTYAASGVVSQAVCPDSLRPTVGNCPTNFTNRMPTATVFDCADGNPAVSPAVSEACDGIDNNCTGGIDEGVGMTYYRDGDDDGYGNVALSMFLCNPPDGYVTNSLDCNDMVSAVNPMATEVCDDFDNDCDGTTNEGFATSTHYRDADGDFHGTPMVTREQCGPFGGYVVSSDDCDDANPARHGGASEPCGSTVDEDCSGGPSGGPTWYRDFDGDMWGRDAGSVIQCTAPVTGVWVLRGGDCRDDVGFESVNPAAMELCDGYDTDCSLVAEPTEGEVPNAFGLNNPNEDGDGDGHGDATCTGLPVGAASLLDDCNDSAADVYLNAPQIVGDEVDNNCSAAGVEICFVDGDSDGYRHTNTTLTVNSTDIDCDDAGEGVATEAPTDCLDSNAAVSPGDPELADNSLDDDCDGLWGCFYDADNDGYSRSDAAVRDDSADNACTGAGEGTTGEPRTDCNDANPAIAGGLTEVADDGLDNDCDGLFGCFYDADSDGFRAIAVTVRDDSTDADCLDLGEGATSEPATDCQDNTATAYPGAPLVADDTFDNNCNGTHECWYDADNDGYSRSDAAIRDTSADADCLDGGEGASSEPRTDCNDASAAVSPGNADIPANAVDENCSGFWACYIDDDDDGYSRSDAAVRDDSIDADCLDTNEGASSEPRTDCDDTRSSTSPGDPEVAGNTFDENCDGIWFCYYDDDNDLYSRSDSATRASADADCADAGEGSSSEPRTDCCDTDNRARPSGGSYSTPTACGGYDFNCSGTETPVYGVGSGALCSSQTTMSFCLSVDGSTSYFMSGPPPCGGSGVFQDQLSPCAWVSGACVVAWTTGLQRCF